MHSSKDLGDWAQRDGRTGLEGSSSSPTGTYSCLICGMTTPLPHNCPAFAASPVPPSAPRCPECGSPRTETIAGLIITHRCLDCAWTFLQKPAASTEEQRPAAPPACKHTCERDGLGLALCMERGFHRCRCGKVMATSGPVEWVDAPAAVPEGAVASEPRKCGCPKDYDEAGNLIPRHGHERTCDLSHEAIGSRAIARHMDEREAEISRLRTEVESLTKDLKVVKDFAHRRAVRISELGEELAAYRSVVDAAQEVRGSSVMRNGNRAVTNASLDKLFDALSTLTPTPVQEKSE
jgi:hypothetical protein